MTHRTAARAEAIAAPTAANLFTLIGERATAEGAAIALITGSASMTYAELHARASRVGRALRAAGIRRGDRVGMLVGNSAEWVEICLGAAAIGAVPAPFSTWSTARELDFLIADSHARILFAVERFGDRHFASDLAGLLAQRTVRYPELARVVTIGGDADDYTAFLAGADGDALDDGARGDDIAYILFTSGSTAHPKAVPLLHGDAIVNGFNIGERQGLRPGDRVFFPLPLFWSYGAANALCATFTHGAALVLQSRFEPGEALDLIERHRCTSIYTLPAVTAALIGHASFRPARTASLRTGMTIGTPQDIMTVAEVLGAREVCNIYGQTESYGNCAVTWHHWPLERRKATQGPPLPGVSMRIVDPKDGHPLPQGATGLIEVKGHLTPGYVGASVDQNAKVFTADGFFRTGDLGHLTPEGDIVFEARDSEMIKRAGVNIAPVEVEEILRQHPAVAAAGVTGSPDPVKGEIVVAFIVPERGKTVSGEELRAHCRALAASYKTPDRIEIRDSLPTTNTGKLLRRELKQMAAAARSSGDTR